MTDLGTCTICGKPKEQRIMGNGKREYPSEVRNRKTCGATECKKAVAQQSFNNLKKKPLKGSNKPNRTKPDLEVMRHVNGDEWMERFGGDFR